MNVNFGGSVVELVQLNEDQFEWENIVAQDRVTINAKIVLYIIKTDRCMQGLYKLIQQAGILQHHRPSDAPVAAVVMQQAWKIQAYMSFMLSPL